MPLPEIVEVVQEAMSPTLSGDSCRAFRIECENGRRYVIYHPSLLGSRPDHLPAQWYFQPYPAPLGLVAGELFDSPEEAAGRIRRRNRVNGPPSSRYATNRPSQLLTPTVLLAACGDDAEGLEILCQVFRTHAPSYMAEVENTLRDGNGPRLSRVAHKFRGLLLALSSVAGSTAATIEDHAARGQLQEARPVAQRLALQVREIHDQVCTLSLKSLRSQRTLAENRD